MDSFCTKCGTKLDEGDSFCSRCGNSNDLSSPPVQATQKGKSSPVRLIGIAFLVIVLISMILDSSSPGRSAVQTSQQVQQPILTASLPTDVAEPQTRTFPNEKCVTESGVRICDLSYSVQRTFSDGTREVGFVANFIDCINVATVKQSHSIGNSIQIEGGNTYCVADIGTVYIDPTIFVSKYFNKIMRDNYDSPYYLSTPYETCIWTYTDGSGQIPYIMVSNSTGPANGYDVNAFCQNGNNQVDIYSYESS